MGEKAKEPWDDGNIVWFNCDGYTGLYFAYKYGSILENTLVYIMDVIEVQRWEGLAV